MTPFLNRCIQYLISKQRKRYIETRLTVVDYFTTTTLVA